MVDGAVLLDQAAEADADADAPSTEDAPYLASTVEVEDYAVFLERTVPMLDICFVASHGRLLLARSRTRYYVCDAAANRWLVLPPPALPNANDWGHGVGPLLRPQGGDGAGLLHGGAAVPRSSPPRPR